MVYFFYKKQPKYNYLKYHTYSKKESSKVKDEPPLPASIIEGGNLYSESDLYRTHNKYDPPLPTTVIDEIRYHKGGDCCYGKKNDKINDNKKVGGLSYDPALPSSVIVEGDYNKDKDELNRNENGIYGDSLLKDRNVGYDPPLPSSVIGDDKVYGEEKRGPNRRTDQIYYPALPSSVIENSYDDNTGAYRTLNKNGTRPYQILRYNTYDPPLPSTIQYIKSTKPSKHQTGKPLPLMEFLLKYWTDEGDTVFDPTFGGGSMPIECKKMNRKFIGCELNKKFYDEFMTNIEKY